MPSDKPPHCSFCGKPQHEVIKLIAGTICFICNECIVQGYGLLDETTRNYVPETPK